MTWTNAFWKATGWVLPNVLAGLGLIVLFYIVGVADAGPFETLVWVVLVVSFCCLVAVPLIAGFVHRSGKVAVLAALYEVGAVSALAGIYLDFFGGWVPRGFHP